MLRIRLAQEPFQRFCDGTKTAEARNLYNRAGHRNGAVTPLLRPESKGEPVEVVNGYNKAAPRRQGIVGEHWHATSWHELPSEVRAMVDAEDPSKFIRMDEQVVVVEITGCNGGSRNEQ